MSETSEKKPGVVIYGNYLDYLEPLPLSQRGKVFTALLLYAEREEEVTADYFSSRIAALAYTVMLKQAKRDRERYLEICEQNRNRALRRWRKGGEEDGGEREPLHASACQRMPPHTTACYNNNNNNNKNNNNNNNNNNNSLTPLPPCEGGAESAQHTGGARRRTQRTREVTEKRPASFDGEEFFRRAMEASYGAIGAQEGKGEDKGGAL